MAMQKLTAEQLKKLLRTTHIKGTPEQIRMLAVRVGELCKLNGRAWVKAHATQLLAQWDMVLDRLAKEEVPSKKR